MASAEKSVYVDLPANQVFSAAQAALEKIGAKIRSADASTGEIVAAVGLSLFSFGDEIRCELRSQPPGTSLHITSNTPGQIMAWGKNQQNIEKFEQALYSLLGTSGQTIAAAASPAVSQAAVQTPVTQSTPTPAKSPQRSPRIFISYRRADSIDICGRIYDRLSADLGRDGIFKDVDSIPIGVDFVEHLDTAVKQCNVLLAVIGPQWIDITDANGSRRLDDPSDFVRIEIESALRRDIRVVPLLVSGATMPSADTLPATLQPLARRNAIQIRPDPDFHNDMSRLIKGLLEQH